MNRKQKWIKRLLAVSKDEAYELLKSKGYSDNILGDTSNNLTWDDDTESLCASKQWDDEKVAVALYVWGKKDMVEYEVYRYKGQAKAHQSISGVRNHTKYTDEIKELWEGLE